MALACKSSVARSAVSRPAAAIKPFTSNVRLTVRAQSQNGATEDLSRRAAVGMLAGMAAMVSGAAPSKAAYGDSANVFGRVTNTSGFVPYAGEGFAIALPSKWNPSKEREVPGIVLRYEDNFDAVNNALVLVLPAKGGDISSYGSPEQFVESVSYLLGKQAFQGETVSEGGFAPGRVASASLLDVSEPTDKKGKKYYQLEFLTRSADGDEGGRHQLIKATVSGGKLYLLKVQVGDKRWFKGVKKEAVGMLDSFTVA